MMKPLLYLLLGFLLIFTFLNNFLVTADYEPDDVLTIEYCFQTPEFESVLFGDVIYDMVTISGCSNGGVVGKPNLPIKGAYILLPKDSQVQNIILETHNRTYLGSGFNIEYVEEPVVLSEMYNTSYIYQQQSNLASLKVYPTTHYSVIGTYSMKGFQILVLSLYPMQYDLVTGDLWYYEQISITIQLDTTQENYQHCLFRNQVEDFDAVADRVDNPDVLQTYTQDFNNGIKNGDQWTLENPDDDYELMIITTDPLESSFIPLKTAHETRDCPTIIVTLSDIGSSNVEHIRNYIRDKYNEWGINYVLIGGDDDVVPACRLWVRTNYHVTTMPSDLYYACLDGTYNFDGDINWGEPNDGENGRDVDLLAEVYVGRACVGTPDQVDHFVHKTITYMDSDQDDEYLSNVLFVGEHLGFGGIANFGGNYKDEMIDGSSNHGYETQGIPSDKYDIQTLYDRDRVYPPGWFTSEIKSYINNGVHIINHLGHANYDYNMKMQYADVSSLTNEELCFIYSQGCNAGGFDVSDCIAEHFTVKNDHAAFAGIWNARYGFGVHDSTDGPSQRYDREFWDAVFAEDKHQLGKANQDSKEDNLYRIGQSCMRWCYYELNLFGDPAVSLLDHQNRNLCDQVYDGHGGPLNPGNPYQVQCNVVVPFDQSLTVNPGVQVDFNAFSITAKCGSGSNMHVFAENEQPVQFFIDSLGKRHFINLYNVEMRLKNGGYIRFNDS